MRCARRNGDSLVINNKFVRVVRNHTCDLSVTCGRPLSRHGGGPRIRRQAGRGAVDGTSLLEFVESLAIMRNAEHFSQSHPRSFAQPWQKDALYQEGAPRHIKTFIHSFIIHRRHVHVHRSTCKLRKINTVQRDLAFLLSPRICVDAAAVPHEGGRC